MSLLVRHLPGCLNYGSDIIFAISTDINPKCPDAGSIHGCHYEHILDIKPEPARELSKSTTFRACEWLRAVADMLEEKGRLYGNSIDNPVRIFNRASKADGLAARIDDKLARIRASAPGDSEDSVKDLVGYIALWVEATSDER